MKAKSMKPVKLSTLLKREHKTADDFVEWEYYGYGCLQRNGYCKVSELPREVSHYGKCFDIRNGVYCVDGAL